LVYVIRVREFQIEVPGLAVCFVTLGKSLLKLAKYCCSVSQGNWPLSQRNTEICSVVICKKLIVQWMH